MIVSYATQAGRTAEDGVGRNSPYTAAFLKHIEEQDEIGAIFRRIASDVYVTTHRSQLPELSLSFVGEYYLRGRPENVAAPASAPDACAAAAEHWKSAEAIATSAAFEDHLARFPNCAFAGLARARIESLKVKIAALAQPAEPADDTTPITDPGSLRELRERLYELNFDPGPFEGPANALTRQAIRECQSQNHLPPTGTASLGLLRRLREVPSPSPWGAIVYGKGDRKWGMSWGEATRKAAVDRAQASCGGGRRRCQAEISFFGGKCGVFAHSASSWAIAAREDVGKAKEAALADCRKGGSSCEIVASVCADGTGK